MPGRKYSAGSGYRYGFNGKENDNEVKGEGNQQDYGMRIYDPRLGKFLSVDPITKNYPELTPYQFASNNPVEGIDLDGLEYVSSESVRISLSRGDVSLKVENMRSVVRNRINSYINDTKNWGGGLGVSLSIANLNLEKLMPPSDPGSDTDPSDANSPATRPPGQILIGINNAKSTGMPDRRFTVERTVSGAVPRAAKGFAIATIGTEVIIKAANWYIGKQIKKEEKIINQHVGYLNNARFDVFTALSEGMIPKKFQTVEYLSAIVGVVLSGESDIEKRYNYLLADGVAPEYNYAKEIVNGIRSIGLNIFNNVSMRRFRYKPGPTKVVDMGSGQKLKIPTFEANPIYDPTYGVERIEGAEH